MLNKYYENKFYNLASKILFTHEDSMSAHIDHFNINPERIKIENIIRDYHGRTGGILAETRPRNRYGFGDNVSNNMDGIMMIDSLIKIQYEMVNNMIDLANYLYIDNILAAIA